MSPRTPARAVTRANAIFTTPPHEWSDTRRDLTPAICRIPVRTHEQRHMVMLRFVAHFKRNRHLGEKRVRLAEVRAGAEGQAKRSLRGRLIEQRATASVVIGLAVTDDDPVIRFLSLERDFHAGGGAAARSVEDVCGDAAHDTSFSNRNRVIFRCSSAAMRNSFAGSFCSRSRAIASISSADLPVAQTM